LIVGFGIKIAKHFDYAVFAKKVRLYICKNDCERV